MDVEDPLSRMQNLPRLLSACPLPVWSEVHLSPTLLCSGRKLGQSFSSSEDAPFEKRKHEIRICCFPRYIGPVAIIWEALVAGVLLQGKLGVQNQKRCLPPTFLLFFPYGNRKISRCGWETEVD